MNLQESERFISAEQRIDFILDVLLKKGLVVLKDGKIIINEELK